MAFVAYQKNSFAQYNLPKAEVLVKNDIREIHVIKTPIRMENGRKKDITEKSFDRIPRKLSTYFISPNGRIDSVYQYAGDTTKYTKHLFKFDQNNNLVEIKVIRFNDELIKHTTLEKTSNNEFLQRTWQTGVLQVERKITSDSLIYETTFIRAFTPVKYYTTITYDFDKDIKTETTYEDDIVVAKETYQWIAKQGVPLSFNYSKYTHSTNTGKTTNKSKKFKVAMDGSVINKNNGLFTDPFYKFNYFNKYDRFEKINHPFESRLREKTLVANWEYSEIVKFDGTKIIYNYNISYEK